MDIRRQEIKISHNNSMGVWELRYGNHPKVISYSSDWEFLDDLSIVIVKEYFKGLKLMTIQTNTCENVM